MTERESGSGLRPFTRAGGDQNPDDIDDRDLGAVDSGSVGEVASSDEAALGVDDARGARPALRALDDDTLAPVIPLFGNGEGAHPSRGGSGDAPAGSSSWRDRNEHPAQRGSRGSRRGFSRVDGPGDADEGLVPEEAAPSPEEIRERAESVLLRKLNSRSLSLSEARTVLRGVDGVDDAITAEIIDHFLDLRYLDDASFAEQLAMSATERRGQGRRAVAETLRKRGISRDVAEATIAEMPDDDAERALDFARSKVRSVGGKDFDTDLRRLVGQLARRGYPSSVALTAARTALDEAGLGRSRSTFRSSPSTSVRFTPDD
ncbi:regulatory protein RecX [Microbacterium sp. CFBP 8794]|uniref:regulatory protein RecX n=1 Tax=Microbacterium sp. CFBP 8794 TaxID=2775269 RepID=UPI00177E9FA8|nr:regulatory protein RecX [Microbacterium sp. CFBP 8794]MBD8479313.1 RecX family transcriptional regulator [Microbacterium sp. CFBP 8794]